MTMHRNAFALQQDYSTLRLDFFLVIGISAACILISLHPDVRFACERGMF